MAAFAVHLKVGHRTGLAPLKFQDLNRQKKMFLRRASCDELVYFGQDSLDNIFAFHATDFHNLLFSVETYKFTPL